ncbi:M20 family metallopeptidase [Jeotgalibacillus soli]|uniref:Peptidase M20 n=1 Tax=Jeotgalibacillus soli TaxID=889306 RepID=A0A0C2RDZ2_9BACL|nr:M20 family metallopeptidase [Jeotgalibacillus soli]KIL48480.1 peptidase M20 [Jeotgalibacillus soli]
MSNITAGRITDFLQSKQSEMIEMLKILVEKESTTVDKKLNDELGAYIAELFRQMTGGKTTTIQNDLYGNHIKGEFGSGTEQILILAHFDTVWQKGDILEKIPFKIVDDQAYGPGTFDMKGGLVQGLYALHALKELNETLSKKVVFLFTSDEELGSPTSQHLIEEEAKKSVCVLVLEPAISTEGALKTSRKGVGMFKLSIQGRAAHAGVEPEKGLSAIHELSKQVSYLYKLTDLKKGTTVNVGTVSGGTTINVVAAEANADIDLRVKTQAEFDRVIPIIKNLKPNIEGLQVEVSGGVNRPPLERTEEVVNLYNKAKKIAKEDLGFTLLEKETGGGSDGNFTAPFAPTLDGLGAVGDGAHALHEHLFISEMPKRSALLALLLKELGS